jgi:hypothetical protein
VATITTAEGTVHERRYGWLEPAIPDLGAAKRFTALSVGPCPTCSSPENQACDGPRTCQARIKESLRRIAEGSLEEAPERAPEAVPEPCAYCSTRVRQGVLLACEALGHRCTFTRSGRRCARPVAKDGRCTEHPLSETLIRSRKWADRLVVSHGGWR